MFLVCLWSSIVLWFEVDEKYVWKDLFWCVFMVFNVVEFYVEIIECWDWGIYGEWVGYGMCILGVILFGGGEGV